MSNLILAQSENLTMSSREIAEFTGKRHDHVMRDIKKMLLDLYPAGSPNFGGTYLSEQNKELPLFNLDRKHTDCLLTGYSAIARMKVIERWHELESQELQAIPNFTDPAQAARAWAEQYEANAAKQKQLELAAPKVAFVDSFVESAGNKTFRQVAKMLSANERLFRAFLVSEGFMYKIGGEWTAYQNHIAAGRFSCKVGEKNGHAFTECKFTPKGIEHIAGKWILAGNA